MYYQLMSEPYCMLASDIDNLTIAQFLLYFAKEEDVKGVREISKTELKKILNKNKNKNKNKNDTKKMSREEFLRRGEEIRKKKKQEFQERRQRRIEAAKGQGRTK